MTETKKVTMGLPKKAIDRLAALEENMHVTTKAQAVANSIALTDTLTTSMRDRPGSKLLIERPDGSFETIIIPWL